MKKGSNTAATIMGGENGEIDFYKGSNRSFSLERLHPTLAYTRPGVRNPPILGRLIHLSKNLAVELLAPAGFSSLIVGR